jgi:aarF domain-containing kinase
VQRLLAGVLPLAAMAYLVPSRFHTHAWHTPQPASLSARTYTQPQYRWPPFSLLLPALLLSALEEAAVWLRGLYLAALFSPVLLTAPLVFGLGATGAAWRPAWMDLVLWTIERAGPAFIKWAQWSSSRPDLFPQDLCKRFERLQAGAPAHDGLLSLQAVNAAFTALGGAAGCDSDDALFTEFEVAPVASGSIAQVHRARLSRRGAALTGGRPGQLVAVKVRHPGVTGVMQRDFVLMQRAVVAAGLLPGVSELRLDESVRQFGGPLHEQLDLSVEARHLQRFIHNFRAWTHVSFPRPLYPLVAPGVLVETFEEGDLISGYVSDPEPGSFKHLFLAKTGLNLYMQMLIKDNFCHADLHPGNILVREPAPASESRIGRLLARLLGDRWAAGCAPPPRMVLLDAGMVAELLPIEQENLVGFFRQLTRQDGGGIAHAILSLSERHTCKDPDAFVADMASMFERLDPEYISKNTAAVFVDMIERLRTHSVTLKSTVSTFVVTALVLEGWSNKLDPDLHILDTMRDILNSDWHDRISRVVDTFMSSSEQQIAVC